MSKSISIPKVIFSDLEKGTENLDFEVLCTPGSYQDTEQPHSVMVDTFSQKTSGRLSVCLHWPLLIMVSLVSERVRNPNTWMTKRCAHIPRVLGKHMDDDPSIDALLPCMLSTGI